LQRRSPNSTRARCSRKSMNRNLASLGGETVCLPAGDFSNSAAAGDMNFWSACRRWRGRARALYGRRLRLNCQSGSYTQLDAPRDSAKVFDTTNTRAGRLPQSETALWCVSPCSVLMRVPYGKGTKPVDGFHYEEGVTGEDHFKYSVGKCRLCGWAPASPMPSPATAGARPSAVWKAAAWWTACPLILSPPSTRRGAQVSTETIITDRREKELSDLGFAPLVHCKALTTRLSSVSKLARSLRSTTQSRLMPTPGSPRSCLTCWLSPASPTI